MVKTIRSLGSLLLFVMLTGCGGNATTPVSPAGTITSTSESLAPAAATATATTASTNAAPVTNETVIPAATDVPAPAETIEEGPTATSLAAGSSDLTVLWSGELSLQNQQAVTFAAARSISAAISEDGLIYVVLGEQDYIYVTRSSDRGGTFSEAIQVSQDQPAFILPFERPAIVATSAGQVNVAWSSPELQGRIWQAQSLDGGQTFFAASPISENGAFETVLPRLTLDDAENPVAAWLSDSRLQLSFSQDAGASYGTNLILDELTCECCHPQPLILGEQIYVAYRNLEYADDGNNIRDIYLISSHDGGENFANEVRVSDSNWFVNACPVSGPSLASDGQNLYVSWMDGRNDTERTFRHTDIWLAVSDDNGQTFAANRRVNHLSGNYHNLPSLVIDDVGVLHMVWESWEESREVIYYARSVDQGMTFSLPIALVDSSAGAGRRPGNTTLIVGNDGLLIMSWVDSSGAHVMSWEVGE